MAQEYDYYDGVASPRQSGDSGDRRCTAPRWDAEGLRQRAHEIDPNGDTLWHYMMLLFGDRHLLLDEESARQHKQRYLGDYEERVYQYGAWLVGGGSGQDVTGKVYGEALYFETGASLRTGCLGDASGAAGSEHCSEHGSEGGSELGSDCGSDCGIDCSSDCGSDCGSAHGSAHGFGHGVGCGAAGAPTAVDKAATAAATGHRLQLANGGTKESTRMVVPCGAWEGVSVRWSLP
jgi:hypothetical protein